MHSDPSPVRFRRIQPTDDLARIQVSDDESRKLREFLLASALAYQQEGLAQTHGLFEVQPDGQEHIFAFMTLVTAGLDTGKTVTLLRRDHLDTETYDPDAEPIYPYSVYPAVKIARLLVGDSYRGQDYGIDLVARAARIVTDLVLEWIGCRFLIVDSKPDSVGFYEKCGFEILQTKNNLKREHPIMFFDLKTAIEGYDSTPPPTQRAGSYLPSQRR